MKYLIPGILKKRKLISDISTDKLYEVGIQNIVHNIEFYHDKKYSCESVIIELFERGIENYIKKVSFK